MDPSPDPSPRRWGGEPDQPRAASISPGVTERRFQPAHVTTYSPPHVMGSGRGRGSNGGDA
jgi:hypothetical protein